MAKRITNCHQLGPEQELFEGPSWSDEKKVYNDQQLIKYSKHTRLGRSSVTRSVTGIYIHRLALYIGIIALYIYILHI